jgi:hypothetical protein
MDCDHYEAVVSESGAYLNFELPGRAAFARVGPNRSVVEVASLGDSIIVSHGHCDVAPPPIVRSN